MAPKIIKNLLFLGGASAANVGLTALQSLLLGRILNVEMFGVTRTATAYMVFLTMLGHFTLHNALAASIVKASERDEIASYIMHAAILVLAISSFVATLACAVVAFSGYWTDDLRLPLIIIISSLPIACLTILFNACLEALGEYKTYMQVIFLAGLVPLVLLIPGAWFWGINGWLAGKVLSSAILLIVAMTAIKYYLKPKSINRNFFYELFAFSRIQIFSGLLSLVLLSADVILLEALTHDLRAVANYGAALLFYSACAIIPTTIGRVYFKQIAPSAALARKKQVEFLIFACSAGLICSALLYTIGPFALGLFFNQNYEHAKVIIKVMALGLTFNFLWNCLSTINIATSHPKSAVAISFTGSVIGLVALLILIPKYQATGAAISMALAYVSGVVLGLILLRKKLLSRGVMHAD